MLAVHTLKISHFTLPKTGCLPSAFCHALGKQPICLSVPKKHLANKKTRQKNDFADAMKNTLVKDFSDTW
jgi:hypothetical protein